MTRRKVKQEDLAAAARAALGRDREIREVPRLTGGTNKGVYRLTLDDGSSGDMYAASAPRVAR